MNRSATTTTRHLLKTATHQQRSGLLLVNSLTSQQQRNIKYVSSRNAEEANRNVLRMYRKWLRVLPWMKDVYHLPTEPGVMIKRIKREFMKNADVKEPEMIDALVYRAYQDFEEVEMHHKQRGHVLRFFAEDEPAMMNPRHNKTSSLGETEVSAGALPEHIVSYLKDHPELMEQFKQLMK